MPTALSTMRTAVAAALASLDAEVYRRRQTDYQYPCVVVGWPDEFDVRATQDGQRDATLPVLCGVEVFDDESADDELSDLLEQAISALLAGSAAWDVLPATEFGEQLLADDRRVIWATLPLRVMA